MAGKKIYLGILSFLCLFLSLLFLLGSSIEVKTAYKSDIAGIFQAMKEPVKSVTDLVDLIGADLPDDFSLDEWEKAIDRTLDSAGDGRLSILEIPTILTSTVEISDGLLQLSDYTSQNISQLYGSFTGESLEVPDFSEEADMIQQVSSIVDIVTMVYYGFLAVTLLFFLYYLLMHIFGKKSSGICFLICSTIWGAFLCLLSYAGNYAANKYGSTIFTKGSLLQISIWPVLSIVCGLMAVVFWKLYWKNKKRRMQRNNRARQSSKIID